MCFRIPRHYLKSLNRVELLFSAVFLFENNLKKNCYDKQYVPIAATPYDNIFLNREKFICYNL